ncbi:MAG: hypothetical protein R2697_07715 [Ilumatobacteraceae bacterium]
MPRLHRCLQSEHDVPLGVNRTWLKYIETGEFPNTGRSFSVMRCNHCDGAPCMTICPTSALFAPTTVSSTSTTTAASAASRA